MKFIKLVIAVFALLLIFISFVLMDFNDLIVKATSEINSNSTQPLNQVLVQPELTTSETIAQTDNLQNPSIQDSFNQQQQQSPILNSTNKQQQTEIVTSNSPPSQNNVLLQGSPYARGCDRFPESCPNLDRGNQESSNEELDKMLNSYQSQPQ